MATYEYLGNGNPDGTILGRTASELVAFHGSTPVAQQAAGSAAPTTTATSVPTTTITTGATSTSPYGFADATQANNLTAVVAALVATVNVLKLRMDDLTTSYNTTRTRLVAKGIVS